MATARPITELSVSISYIGRISSPMPSGIFLWEGTSASNEDLQELPWQLRLITQWTAFKCTHLPNGFMKGEFLKHETKANTTDFGYAESK